MHAVIANALASDGYGPILGSTGDQYLEPSLAREVHFKDFVGSSPAIKLTLEQIESLRWPGAPPVRLSPVLFRLCEFGV